MLLHMTTTTSNAQQIADAFVRAWLSGDVDLALSYVSSDVVCDAPSGRIEGVEGYREFVARFVGMITGGAVIDVLGDDTRAVTVYSTDLPFMKDFRGIDHFTVANGRITHIITVFDRLPVHLARSNASN
jgi:hypothetical protein